MKNGKKLTREMKMLLIKNGFNANDYLYYKNDSRCVCFVNKVNGEKIIIEKD